MGGLVSGSAIRYEMSGPPHPQMRLPQTCMNYEVSWRSSGMKCGGTSSRGIGASTIVLWKGTVALSEPSTTPMDIDYKLSTVMIDEQGRVTAVVRFYSGEVNTQDELVQGVLQPVTRYRRAALLREVSVSLPSVALLHAWAKRELSRDTTRTPIPAQVLTTEDLARVGELPQA